MSFKWSVDSDKAFLALKSCLASRLVLRPPDFNHPFAISLDASDVAIGACLFQVYDGLDHPVSFISKKLDKHRRSYATVENEAYALKTDVEHFRVYLDTGMPIQI